MAGKRTDDEDDFRTYVCSRLRVGTPYDITEDCDIPPDKHRGDWTLELRSPRIDFRGVDSQVESALAYVRGEDARHVRFRLDEIEVSTDATGDTMTATLLFSCYRT